MKCRHCRTPLEHIFLDLGQAPPSNAYLSADALQAPEAKFPLQLYVCDRCWLVQTADHAEPQQLFTGDYAYFSSTSRSWLEHAARYAEMIIGRLALTSRSLVIEIAANDGYLLRNFLAAGIPCLGIEPTQGTADAAEKLGIPVRREFFGAGTAAALAATGQQADLICGNNVYAHVPDINDFTIGLRIALKTGGTITLEFPHLMRLIENNQFDTVYHEHYSYLSLLTVDHIFAAAGLRVFDVEELPTHGGSLRIYGCHAGDPRPTASGVDKLLRREREFGLENLAVYREFQKKADKVGKDFVDFVHGQRQACKTIAAYGAAAKGNTLLNYAGIQHGQIDFVCDAAPSKQGKFLPGSHIPILAPNVLAERRPDWVVIFPWNIAHEITSLRSEIRTWGGRFVVAVPKLKVLP